MRQRKVSQVFISVVATLGLGAGLLAGAAPAASAASPGIIVAPVVGAPDDGFAQYVVTFRATPAMGESEIIVVREGNVIRILEVEGDPSMAVDSQPTPGVTCVGDNPAGVSSEIRCTFSRADSRSSFGVWGIFADAPRGVTFAVEANSRIKAFVLGSAFDDYIQGGPMDDALIGGDGDDFLFGGGGSDALAGGPGDDVIYGEGGEDGDVKEVPGDDLITGGPGDDYIDAGPGRDGVWGGPGNDEIDVRDGEEDWPVSCEDNDKTKDRGSITFDRGLDRPSYCNATQVPILASPIPLSQINLVKPGIVLRAGRATWLGSTPMTYSYQWQACRVARDGTINGCEVRVSGNLTAAGLDAKTGKEPTYTVTRADAGRAARFVAMADNSKLTGGAKVSAGTSFTNVITAPNSITVRAGSFPQQSGKNWTFAKVGDFIKALVASEIGPYVGYSSTAWKKAAVPKNMRKAIKDGDIFSIRVDGKEIKPDAIVEAAADAPAIFEIRFFSSLEQRKTCPVTDAEVNAINRTASTTQYDLVALTSFLDSRKCPWSLVNSGKTSTVPRFTVDSVSLGESPDEDSASDELVIATRKPNTSGQLSLAVGAPPNSIVAQSPGHFTVGSAGAVYAFPGTVFTSIWVNLVGDQARMPNKRARMELFVNGRLKVKQELAANFSSIPATVFAETGTARIVMTTFENSGAARAQVFADFDIRNPATAPLEDLITLDGRCFDRLGNRVTNCMDRAPGARVAGIRDVVSRSNARELSTFGAVEALRYASERLNLRFTPIVVNGAVSDLLAGAPRTSVAAGQLSVASCAWWDVVCLLRTVAPQVAKAVIRAAKKVVEAFVRLPAIPIREGTGVPAVTQGAIARVGDAGLIGLDGASLLSDQGGSLIGLDGASLIGLDGASLIGLDGASLIGLDGASAQPTVVTLPLISAGGLG